MKISKKAIFSCLFLLIGFFLINTWLAPLASADDSLWNSQVGSPQLTNVFGGDQAKQDVRAIVVKVINVALTFLAIILLFLLVLAGFKYMLSGGNESKAKEAQTQIKNALIGLIIVLASWIIARYVIVITDQIMTNKVDYTNYQTW